MVLSSGSKIYSYSLVPKSGKKYLEPFLVNIRCIKSAFVSSATVVVVFKKNPLFQIFLKRISERQSAA